jgi:hypothetical protein
MFFKNFILQNFKGLYFENRHVFKNVLKLVFKNIILFKNISRSILKTSLFLKTFLKTNDYFRIGKVKTFFGNSIQCILHSGKKHMKFYKK